ncbi:MAG: prepilin peptidase, partial [Terriglobales bacterium]
MEGAVDIVNNAVQTVHNMDQTTKDVVAGLVGLCVGSFLNVLALRSLEEKSIFWPPSSCPQCKTRLWLLDMIPVVSWLALKGKCRHCSKPISWHYPVVELLTAVAFIAVLRVFDWTFEGFGMVFFACVLIAVCVTDFREKLIP